MNEIASIRIDASYFNGIDLSIPPLTTVLIRHGFLRDSGEECVFIIDIKTKKVIGYAKITNELKELIDNKENCMYLFSCFQIHATNKNEEASSIQNTIIYLTNDLV